MDELKIDAQRIIDVMSEEVAGYISKLSVAKAQIESLAKVIDAQNQEMASLRAKVEEAEKTKKASK